MGTNTLYILRAIGSWFVRFMAQPYIYSFQGSDMFFILAQTIVCVKAIHPTTDFVGRGFLAEFYKQGYQARYDFRKSQLDRFVNWRVYSYDPSLEHATQIIVDGLKERQKDFEFKEKKYRNALEQIGVAI